MRAGIALGSNLGDRAATLNAAIDALRTLSRPGGPFLQGRILESEPVNCPPNSPPFLNSAVEIEWSATPHLLLDRLQALELQFGRPTSHGTNTPRTLDLDLLYCDHLLVSSPRLTLPHPLLPHRPFVLIPLSDICPTRVLPGSEKSIAELLDSVTSE